MKTVEHLWLQPHNKQKSFSDLQKKPKKWVADNYLVKTGQGKTMLKTFDINNFNREIIQSIQMTLWDNVNINTGEIKQTMVFDFKLFNDTTYRTDLTHKIVSPFVVDSKKYSNHRKHLIKVMKKHPEDVELIKDDLLHLSRVNDSFKKYKFDRTGKQRMRGDDLKRYHLFPCVNSYRGFRQSRTAMIHGFCELTDDYTGTAFLFICDECFIIPFVRVQDNTGEDTFVGSNKKGFQKSKGYYHRDIELDSEITWSGYSDGD